MTALLKKDLFINRNYLLMILFLIPYLYVMNISPAASFVGLQIGLLIGSFYCDQQAGINQFLVSLPVSRREIIRARYLFAALFAFLTLAYLVLIDQLAHRFLPYFEYPPVSGRTAFIFVCVSLVIYALSFPIYFRFSYILALVVQVLLFILLPGAFFLALKLLVKGDAPWLFHGAGRIFASFSDHPFLIAPPAALASYLLSLFLSQRIFMKKDLK